MTTKMIRIATPRCFYCGQRGEILGSLAGVEKYEAGALMQDAFPDMSAPEREQLISGTHPECWKKMFA